MKQSSGDRSSRTTLNLGTIGGSFAYGFVVGLIASIVFEGFDIASNLLQAAIFGVIFTVVHIGFRLLRSRR
jgi:hypothetical protein